jgi:hypothetical protein
MYIESSHFKQEPWHYATVAYIKRSSTVEKFVYRYGTCFPIYEWPWPCYHGNEIGCCSVDHYWSSKYWATTESMKNQHFKFWPQCAYNCFPEDTTCIVLFREMVSKNYRNLIKVVRALFKRVTIIFCVAHLKGPYFWS